MFVLAATLSWGQPAPLHDEQRVRGSIPWRVLAAGQPREAAYNAFYFTYARPGLAVAYAPAGLASWILGAPRPAPDPGDAWWLDALDVRCALLWTAVWAALGVLWAGRLGERLGGRGAGALSAWWLALSVVVLHQARTLFPAIPALALSALFLERYLAARAAPGTRPAVVAGLALGAAFAVYPGVYPLGLVLPVDLARGRAAARARVGAVLLTLLGVLLTIELLTRLSYGGSYLTQLTRLSGGILAGDPREGWSFPWEYLGRLDRALGVAALGLAFTAPAWARSDDQRLLGWTALGVYAWSGLLISTLLGRQVLYGRLVTIWLALLVPLAVCAPGRIGRRRFLAVTLLIGLHQAPGLWRLFTLPRARHPASLYEELGPAERAAATR